MSRYSGTTIVCTRQPGRMHMICASSFHFCLIDIIMILWYTLFWHLYCETLGQSLDQEGVYVTSLSCAHWVKFFIEDTCSQVIQIIILLRIWFWLWGIMGWGHVVLLHWHRQVLLTGFTECAGFWTLRMQRHRWKPLDSGLSRGVNYWGLIVLFVHISAYD